MRQFETTFEGFPHVVTELDDVVFLYPSAPIQGSQRPELTPRATLRQQLPELQLEGRALFASDLPPAAGLDLTTEAGIRSAITLHGSPLPADLIVVAATEATRD